MTHSRYSMYLFSILPRREGRRNGRREEYRWREGGNGRRESGWREEKRAKEREEGVERKTKVFIAP